jgi:hypothetical protein
MRIRNTLAVSALALAIGAGFGATGAMAQSDCQARISAIEARMTTTGSTTGTTGTMTGQDAVGTTSDQTPEANMDTGQPGEFDTSGNTSGTTSTTDGTDSGSTTNKVETYGTKSDQTPEATMNTGQPGDFKSTGEAMSHEQARSELARAQALCTEGKDAEANEILARVESGLAIGGLESTEPAAGSSDTTQ